MVSCPSLNPDQPQHVQGHLLPLARVGAIIADHFGLPRAIGRRVAAQQARQPRPVRRLRPGARGVGGHIRRARRRGANRGRRQRLARGQPDRQDQREQSTTQPCARRQVSVRILPDHPIFPPSSWRLQPPYELSGEAATTKRRLVSSPSAPSRYPAGRSAHTARPECRGQSIRPLPHDGHSPACVPAFECPRWQHPLRRAQT